MKYKNEKDERISRKESEIRKLKALDFRDDITIEKTEPFQYGWDLYFDVDPIYNGTFKEKVWEVLPMLMNIGWEGDNVPHIPRKLKNKLGYYYSDDGQPSLDDINEETYYSLKISHDLFRIERDSYNDCDGNLVSFKNYYPNFLDKLVVRRTPSITDEVRVLDELVLQEESETEYKIKILEGNKKNWRHGFSTKGWRKLNRKQKRQKDRRVCRKSLYENFDDMLRHSTLSGERKDMWWYLY